MLAGQSGLPRMRFRQKMQQIPGMNDNDSLLTVLVGSPVTGRHLKMSSNQLRLINFVNRLDEQDAKLIVSPHVKDSLSTSVTVV